MNIYRKLLIVIYSKANATSGSCGNRDVLVWKHRQKFAAVNLERRERVGIENSLFNGRIDPGGPCGLILARQYQFEKIQFPSNNCE
jgi:hypothetical protein